MNFETAMGCSIGIDSAPRFRHRLIERIDARTKAYDAS
jgi:hypothetical protein